MKARVRKGFFERADFDRVLSLWPEYLRPLLQVGFLIGWRVHSELLSRARGKTWI